MHCNATEPITKNDIEQEINSHIDEDNTFCIYQCDFNNGPYVINTPGKYVFMENIVTNFFKKQDDILNLKKPIFKDDKFGPAAAIKVTTNNVIIDLNGYYLAQSPRDYCVQRFFALIQLNSMPFRAHVGPISDWEAPDELLVANNVIIRNGILGLTSHQSIIGNNNKNIIIEKMNCEDFEVSGIMFNNVTNCYIDNSIIGQSVGEKNQRSANHSRDIMLSPYYSGLVFIHRLLSQTETIDELKDAMDKDPSSKDCLKKLQNSIKKVLEPINKIIFMNTSLTQINDNLKKLKNTNDKDILLMINTVGPPIGQPKSNNHKYCQEGVSPCNIHGIKITGLNPSIFAYHTDVDQQEHKNPLPDVDKTYSENINISNIILENMTASIDEELICTENNKIVHVAAGLKATHSLICTSIGKRVVKDIFKLSKNQHLKKLTKTNLTQNIVDFIMEQQNPDLRCGFIGAVDSMGHLNKGVHAIRIGSTKGVNIKNVKVNNIKNCGQPIDKEHLADILKNYSVKEILINDAKFLSPVTYTGSYSIGTIISGCNDVNIKSTETTNIDSPYGASVGIAINNICKKVILDDNKISGLNSCEECLDSTTLVIDEDSTNVTLSNTNINKNSLLNEEMTQNKEEVKCPFLH